MAQHNGHILKVLWAKCADQYQVLSALNVVLTGVQASECGGCNADIELIRKWIGVAARMGSPNLRIFTGRSTHEGFSRKQVFEWMARDIRAVTWQIKENVWVDGLQVPTDLERLDGQEQVLEARQ